MKAFLKSNADLLLLFILSSAALFPVWFLPHFITGDGPAHLYNSRVLLDVLQGNHVDFYKRYYNLNLALYPNWFSTFVLAALQTIFNPFTAEKLLVSAHVLLLPLAAFFFIRSFQRESSFLVLLLLPFSLHFLIYYGFFNYSFGVSMGLLFTGIWWRLRGGNVWKHLLILTPFALLMFFTHAFAWLLLAFMLPAFFAVDVISKERRVALKKWFILGFSVLPAAVLMFLFLKSNQAETQYFPESTKVLWQAFTSLKPLVIFSDSEKAPALALAILLLALLVTAIAWRVKTKQGFQLTDSLLISAIVFLVVFLMQPYPLCLGGFWIPRMAWIPWLMLVLWLNTIWLPKAVSNTAGALAAFAFLWLIALRFPYHQKVSEAVTDYLSACEYIEPNSTVLPLSYSHYGITAQQEQITDKIWLFRHAFDYCGAVKQPIINLANYQGATTWFALKWKQGCNPFQGIGVNNNIEGQPPEVNLNATSGDNCNMQPDYVVTWCRRFKHTDTYQWKNTDAQLNELYKQVYTSPTGRTEVWKRK